MYIVMTDAQAPSTISGLVGWYTGLSAEVTSGSVSSWKDLSGQGNHATTINGSPKVSTTAKVDTGTPGDYVLAFHYGNFDNHYGDGTVGAAASSGRLYSDTTMTSTSEDIGYITASTASGQTTYTWYPSGDVYAEKIIVVAGGGSGGHNVTVGAYYENGGGGGGGGVVYKTNVALTSTSYTITVGQGGVRPSGNGQTKGKDSIAFGYTALGGGGGSTRDSQTNINGGSGGGAVNWNPHTTNGQATQPTSASGGYGNNGGIATQYGDTTGGSAGGGGAGGVGGDAGGVADSMAATIGGNGGAGVSLFTAVYGASGYFGGGGGGGGGTGGTGTNGGGNGGSSTSINGTDGRAHSGAGGGGNFAYTGAAGNGGSGIVIIQFKIVRGRGPTKFPFLYGTTADGLRFPTGAMDTTSTYTLFHVARYYKPSGTPTRGRIFDGVTSNWLSGFHDGRSGVAYHDTWLTPYINYHGDNWVLSMDQRNLYRSNGVQRGTGSDRTSKQLSINYGYYSLERSDWAVAEVIIYNRELTSAEYLAVEAYLTAKYFTYGLIPSSGVISGSLFNAILYNETEGTSGGSAYPLSIGRLGARNGTTYGQLLNASDFRLAPGLVQRTYTSISTTPTYTFTAAQLTTLFGTGTRTSGPTVTTTSINSNGAIDVGSYYGITWIGYIYISTSGVYTFGTNSDDESDIHINRVYVTDAYGGHGGNTSGTPYGTKQYAAYLQKGYHRFYYRFREAGGGEVYEALWIKPGSSSWEFIPGDVFYHLNADKDTSTEPIDPTIV